MLIRKIEVQHFGKFKNKVILDGFGEQFNVLVQPNESGKSTLFHAMRHLFMTNHQKDNPELQSFVPWNTQGMNPQVAVNFSTQNQEYRAVKHFLDDSLCEVYVKNQGEFSKQLAGKNAYTFLRDLVTQPQQNATRKDVDKDQSLIKLLWNIQDSAIWLGEKGKRFFPEVEGNLKEIIYQQIQKQSLSLVEKNFQARLQTELKKYYGNDGKSNEITRRQDADIVKLKAQIKDAETQLEVLKNQQNRHEQNLEQRDRFIQNLGDIQNRLDDHFKQIAFYNQKIDQLDIRLKNFDQIKSNLETLKNKKEQLEKAVFSRENAQSEIHKAEHQLDKLRLNQHEIQHILDDLEEQKSLLKEQRYQFEALKGLYYAYQELSEDYIKYSRFSRELTDLQNTQKTSGLNQEQIQVRQKNLKLLELSIAELESNCQNIEMRQSQVEQYQAKLSMIQKDYFRFQEIKQQSLSHDQEATGLVNKLQDLIKKRTQHEKKLKENEGIYHDSLHVYEVINKLAEELQELKLSLAELNKIQVIVKQLQTLRHELNLLPRISTNDFDEIKRLDLEIHKLDSTVETHSTVLNLKFDTDKNIKIDYKNSYFVIAGQESRFTFSQKTVLYIEGVGEIYIEPTNQLLHRDANLLDNYKFKLSRLFKLYDIESIEEASSILEKRQTLQSQIQADELVLKTLLGDYESVDELHEFNYRLVQDIKTLASQAEIVIADQELLSIEQVQEKIDIVSQKSGQFQEILDLANQHMQTMRSHIQAINEDITKTQHQQEFLQQNIQKNKADEKTLLATYYSEEQFQFVLNESQILVNESKERLERVLAVSVSPSELDNLKHRHQTESIELQNDIENYQQDLGRLQASIERYKQEILSILERYEHDEKVLYERYFDAKNALAHEERRIQQVIPWYQSVEKMDELFSSRLQINEQELHDKTLKLAEIQGQINEYLNVINYQKGILETLAQHQHDDETMLRMQFDMTESQYQSVLAKYQREADSIPNLQNERQHMDAEISRHKSSIQQLEATKREQDQQLHRLEGIIEADSSVYHRTTEIEDHLVILNEQYRRLMIQAKAVKLLDNLFQEKSNQFDEITIEKVSDRTTFMWNYVKYGKNHNSAERIQFNDKFIPNIMPEALNGLALGEQNIAHIERFSAGSIEQINILTRLSLIHNLISANNERHLLILDDLLVYSDYDRMKRVLELIKSYADKYLQVVILTCQKDHYERIFDTLKIQPQWLEIQHT